jgi:hypothetical protein
VGGSRRSMELRTLNLEQFRFELLTTPDTIP